MTFRIRPFDSVEVTSPGANAYSIPTTTITGFTTPTSAPFIINVYNNGAATLYIQNAGSAELADGRVILPGESATYGPVTADSFPQLRFDGVGGCWVSFDLWGAGV